MAYLTLIWQTSPIEHSDKASGASLLLAYCVHHCAQHYRLLILQVLQEKGLQHYWCSQCNVAKAVLPSVKHLDCSHEQKHFQQASHLRWRSFTVLGTKVAPFPLLMWGVAFTAWQFFLFLFLIHTRSWRSSGVLTLLIEWSSISSRGRLSGCCAGHLRFQMLQM